MVTKAPKATIHSSHFVSGTTRSGIEAEPAIRQAWRDFEKGQVERARAVCKNIIARAPASAFALHLLGMTEFRLGRIASAERLVTEALEIMPGSVIFLSDLTGLIRTQGRISEAIGICQKIVEIDPQNGEAWYRLGCFFNDLGDLKECIVAFEKSVKLMPDFVSGYINLGVALKKSGGLEAAEMFYLRALEVDPNSASAHYNLGILMHDRGDYELAESGFRKTLQLDPANFDAKYNLGLALYNQHHLKEALELYREISSSAPQHADLRNNMGLVLQELGDLTQAIESFESAIQIDADHGESRFNRAVARLLLGHFEGGWEDYEYRWRTKLQSPPNYDTPWWQGEGLAGKQITVFGEQGPGDVVLFAHCLPDLVACAGDVCIRVEPRLVELFKRSFRDCTVSSSVRDDGSLIPVKSDFVIPFGSLPKYFRRNANDFSARTTPYLRPDPERVERWRKRYSVLGKKFVIGVSWRGGATEKEKKLRTMNLEDWVGIFSRTDVAFVNLQYGDRADEIGLMRLKHEILLHDWEDAVRDLDDFTAQIEALDLVISIANTTVHFAGALHKPVWTLTPIRPSWRWQLERDDSLWYPTMNVIRQHRDEPWSSVLDRVAKKLDDWLPAAEFQ